MFFHISPEVNGAMREMSGGNTRWLEELGPTKAAPVGVAEFKQVEKSKSMLSPDLAHPESLFARSEKL